MRRRTLAAPAAFALAASALSAAAEEAGFDPWTRSARYDVTYRVALDAIQARPGDSLRLWLPAPAASPDQDRLALEVDAPFPATHSTDALGNHVVHLAWEGPAPEGSELVLRARVERRPSRGTAADAVAPGSAEDPARFLAPTRRVPLDGLIGQLADQESRGLATDRQKIRAFYDYVTSHLRYAKEGEGWGRGDAVWACTSKYGNCTDFHSLFLGMARSEAIPARFVIGFPVPTEALSTEGATVEVPGYHCWSEAWDPGRGWLPVDASEAWKAKRFDAYFGMLPSDRIAFTTGRDLRLEPPQAGGPLNFFVRPYVERDGEPVEGVEGRLSVRRIPADGTAARVASRPR